MGGGGVHLYLCLYGDLFKCHFPETKSAIPPGCKNRTACRCLLECTVQSTSLSCRLIASRSLADCVMLAGPYPNTLKRLVSVQECVDQSSHLPLYASGDRQVFAQVGNVAAEAVNYFDGDGDSIRCGPIPGPSPLPPSEWYSHSLRVQSQVYTSCNSAHLLVEVYTCNKASDQFVSTGADTD